jgi:hypothetical protein
MEQLLMHPNFNPYAYVTKGNSSNNNINNNAYAGTSDLQRSGVELARPPIMIMSLEA